MICFSSLEKQIKSNHTIAKFLAVEVCYYIVSMSSVAQATDAVVPLMEIVTSSSPLWRWFDLILSAGDKLENIYRTTFNTKR